MTIDGDRDLFVHVLDQFRFLGKFLAKSMLDSRMVDIATIIFLFLLLFFRSIFHLAFRFISGCSGKSQPFLQQIFGYARLDEFRVKIHCRSF